MTVDTQLEYLAEVIHDQETPITKQEMEQMLVGVQKSKQVNTYRQVDEAPVVVDVMDISDAAAKKLAEKLKPTQSTMSTDSKEPDQSPGFLSKILDFAKGSFINIIKMIGGVIGWVVSTVTGIISSVTGWVLNKIQTAMLRAVATSAGNMRGRFSKLGLIAKLAGGAAAGLAVYNVYDGISDFQSKLTTANDTVSQAFSDPESILTSGTASFDPAFTTPDQTATSSAAGTVPASDTSTTPQESTEESDQLTSIEDTSITSLQSENSINEFIQSQNNTTSIDISDNSEKEIVKQTQPQVTDSVITQPQVTDSVIDNITNITSDETKQIQEFIEQNNMFDEKTDAVVKDMKDITKSTQIKVNAASQKSIESSSSPTFKPVSNSSISKTDPTTEYTPSYTTTDSVVTDITTSERNQEVELYNTIKEKTDEVTNTLQQKINNTPSASLSVSSKVSTPIQLTESPKSSPGTQSLSTSPSNPSSAIDTSQITMQSNTQLNNNTTNLQQTSVDLSTKIENLNKQIASRQAPQIVNVDNTQTATSTDYLTDSDMVRTMARLRP